MDCRLATEKAGWGVPTLMPHLLAKGTVRKNLKRTESAIKDSRNISTNSKCYTEQKEMLFSQRK